MSNCNCNNSSSCGCSRCGNTGWDWANHSICGCSNHTGWNWAGWDWSNCNWAGFNWASRNGCANWGCSDSCPYSRWRHPISCSQAYYSCAGTQDGPTLVIHTIPLEAGCEQSCTPRTYRVRVTGPSYPCGEIFTLRAGSCLELDEPLVISGLTPGTYRIEVLFDCPHTYIHTITGASCGGCVEVSNSAAPTVVTIVSRRRFCRRNRCGCNY